MSADITAETPAKGTSLQLGHILRRAEPIIISLIAMLAGLALFGLFLLAVGKSPITFYELVYKAGFGSAFSWQNTLSRAAPLLLSALCVALPARLGLVVIGGEGAIVLGGVAAGAAGMYLPGLPGAIGIAAMMIATSEPNFDGALTAAISSFSNIGPVYSTGWTAPDVWPAYADFSAFSKLVMIATMILGRIEVLVLLGALNLAYWRS